MKFVRILSVNFKANIMIKGIDISHWQGDRGTINWEKVKAAGYEFVFIKATQGTAYKDTRYLEQVAGARKAGMVVGHYHFAHGADAIKEADFFLSVVSLQKGEPVVLDYEITLAKPAVWCKEWLDRVAEKLGFKPMIYLNESTVKSVDWSSVASAGYGLWEAKYGNNDSVAAESEKPKTDEWSFYAVWQFSSKGSVPGIIGDVDLDLGNFSSVDQLKKYGKQ